MQKKSDKQHPILIMVYSIQVVQTLVQHQDQWSAIWVRVLLTICLVSRIQGRGLFMTKNEFFHEFLWFRVILIYY